MVSVSTHVPLITSALNKHMHMHEPHLIVDYIERISAYVHGSRLQRGPVRVWVTMYAYPDSIIPVLHGLLSQSMRDLPRLLVPISLQCHFDYTMHAWNRVNFGIHCDIK